LQYSLKPYHQKANAAPFPGISLRSFMEQTTTYEDQPVPLTPLLRQGAWIGLVLTLVCTILTLLISAIGYGAISSLLILGNQLDAYLGWFTGHAWLFWVNASLLCSSAALLVVTRGLKQGKLLYHRLAFVLFLAGIANIALFVFPIVVLVINLIILMIIIAMILAIIGVIIAAL
jgi:hypothetical protein